MKIFIPSYQRAYMVRAGTLAWIPKSYHKDTIIVVRDEEFGKYMNQMMKDSTYATVGILGVPATGIGDKRQMILEHCVKKEYKYFTMMDDDLQFFRRKDPSTTNLIPATEDDMVQMLVAMQRGLARYSHVGVSARQGNNAAGIGSADVIREQNVRVMRAVAFRTKEYASIEHNRINGIEDFDATLQLLRKGHSNLNLYWWAQDQQQTNAPGGCSVWRTKKYHEDNVRRLKELHSDFVTLVPKENKTGGDFGTRLEVRVQWKEAWKEGQRALSNSRRNSG